MGDGASRTSTRWLVAGLIAAFTGYPVAGFLFLMAVFSVNACGMFADGCEDYGKPAPEFIWFAGGTVVAFVLATGGVVAVIVALVQSSRRRSQAQ